MQKKPLLFAIIITVAVFIISIIPTQPVIESWGFNQFSKLVNVLLKGTIIMTIYFVLIKKLDLKIYSGASHHIPKNYWMLLIPFIYPGIWTYSKINAACFADMSVYLLTLVTSLIKATLEEVTFRGLIQGYLIKNTQWSYHRCILISASLFALMHTINVLVADLPGVLNQIIYAFFMGLLFGAIQIRINNIWLLGIAHGMLNVLFTDCNNTGMLSNDQPVVTFGDYIVSMASIALVFSPILIIYWLLMRNKRNTERKTHQ